MKWVATTTGDVSGTPVVSGGAVYFGDFGGTVWKLDARPAQSSGRTRSPRYTGIAGDFARTSPSLDGNVLVVGTNKTPLLLGIDATTGALLWKTQVNPDPHGTMTGSPILVGDTIFTGVSAAGAYGPGATFRGDIAAVNALTGQLLWEAFSLPDNGGVPGGYAGATMFSAPAVDAADSLVYGTFGQPYTEPASVAACNAPPRTASSRGVRAAGRLLELDRRVRPGDGAPVWSYRVFGDAPWQSVCGPLPAGHLVPARDRQPVARATPGRGFGEVGHRRLEPERLPARGRAPVVGFGARAASTTCSTQDGRADLEHARRSRRRPGRVRVGHSLRRAAHLRLAHEPAPHPVPLTENGVAHRHHGTGGSWMALDPATGKILWQTADPQTETLPAPTAPSGSGTSRRSRPRTASSIRRRWRSRATRCTRSTRRPGASSGSSRQEARSTPRPPSSTDPSTGAPATRGRRRGAGTTSSTRSASAASPTRRRR